MAGLALLLPITTHAQSSFQFNELNLLVDRALKSGTSALRPWFEMTKAMAEYRDGRFESAIAHCEQARGVDRNSAHATLDVLTAMSHHRLGHGDEAARWLERAQNTKDRPAPRLTEGEHYALFQLLLKEANSMIGTPSTQPRAKESGRQSS